MALRRAEPIRAMLGAEPGRGDQGHRQRGHGPGPGPAGHGAAPAAVLRARCRRYRSIRSRSRPVSSIELADRLATLDLDARLALPGVQTRRAPLLPVGAVVLATLVESLGLQRLVVSEWGLREGAVIGALSLQPERPPDERVGGCASGSGFFLPRIRFIPVPQVGHLPLADRRPLAISTSSPSNCRFSRHFTQYPSYDAMCPPHDSDGGHPMIGWTERIGPGRPKGGWEAQMLAIVSSDRAGADGRASARGAAHGLRSHRMQRCRPSSSRCRRAGQRRAEEVPLSRGASPLQEDPALRRGLDPFGHAVQAQPVGHRDDGRHQRVVVAVGSEDLDEGLVDLEGADREASRCGSTRSCRSRSRRW